MTGRPLVPAPPDTPNALKRLARIAVPDSADLVLLGDSNAAAWPADLLEAALPGWRVFNFGLPGDRIQNTLWRLDAVSTSHLRPRHAVVILGTNNLRDGDAPSEIAVGLAAVVDRISDLWGGPDIIVPAIARRYAGPLARDQEREALNGLLVAMSRPRLRIVRSDVVLDGLGRDAFEPDGIHISHTGYAALSGLLARLLDE